MMNKIWLDRYSKGVPSEVDVNTYQTVLEIFEHSVKKYGNRPAFHNMGTTLSFRDVKWQGRKFASYLQNDLKLKKGDRIALMMPNILQYPIALFGAMQAGLAIVNVNPLYTARELQHQLSDSGAKAIVIFANSAHILEKILGKTTSIPPQNVMVTQIGDFLSFPKSVIVNFVLKYVKKMIPPWNIPGATDFKQALALGDPDKYRRPKVTREDTAFLQYTGGTTGVAKGAVLTHSNIVSNILQVHAWLASSLMEKDNVAITPLPLYHIFSLTVNCFILSSVGALNVLITNPRDIPGFIKELKKWKFTCFTGVNTLFKGLLGHPDFKTVDFGHLKLTVGGGMAVQKSVAEQWLEVTGRPLIEGYGLTETSPCACVNPLDIKGFTGYIGLPLPSTDVGIKDEEGKDVPLGDVGEITIYGPQVMQGYWQSPEETAKVMTSDGHFKTGDMGFMTKEGFIKLVDRKKDMILVSGFNVYPNEIEDVVCQHPKVFEAAAVGVKSDKSGEVVKLFVIKKDDSLTEKELQEYCRENLTPYKNPRIIEFRRDLPKSNVGKILRKELRDEGHNTTSATTATV